MDFASRMAEERIRQAIKDGEFDNLPGEGKRLELEDLSAIPEDMRTSYLMMKNSGYLPEEVRLKKELITLEDMIASCKDPEQKESYKKQLTEKEIQLRIALEKRNLKKSNAYQKYSSKIHKRFGI
ncbi:DnaJ family domain-containing protein [Sediminibacillus massiliensis]|uniref:DnaJ family domain-containing protein n=1 Tax=Sediminibacillus massiliensis TaxID=1926277 RepID=UPI000988389D|nr:DnaJ family domain-containing protein [Sediminibacillus massiliensis]